MYGDFEGYLLTSRRICDVCNIEQRMRGTRPTENLKNSKETADGLKWRGRLRSTVFML